MYATTLFCLLAVLAAASATPANPRPAGSRLSSVDVDKILANPRVLANYVKCVTDKGPCTPEGKEIKKMLPDVIATSCGKCTPQQKVNVRKAVTAVRQKHPDAWMTIVNKYDPKHTHAKELEVFLKA